MDSLISAAKVCDCVPLFRMVLTGMWSRGSAAISPKYSVPAINIVSSVFSLADCTLEKPGAPIENIFQNHLNVALLNNFSI